MNRSLEIIQSKDKIKTAVRLVKYQPGSSFFVVRTTQMYAVQQMLHKARGNSPYNTGFFS